jgi:ACS family hexuronate transporter-like MFS transporter
VFAPRVASLWGAVGLIGLATAGHQGWSANIYTLASDMFPRRAVASVIGFAGMFGAVGGMFIATATGYILQWTGSYWVLFALAGSAYLVALAVIQVLVPRLQPAEV